MSGDSGRSIRAPLGAALNKYVAVQHNATGEAVVCANGTDNFLGLLTDGGAVGDGVSVQTGGDLVDALAGAALTRGTHSLLMCGANGWLYPCTPTNKPVAMWVPESASVPAPAGGLPAEIRVKILGNGPAL